MKWKRSSPSCAKRGFTLIELLVAGALAVVVLGVALGLVITNRKVYDLDRGRTALNQNLRGALDLIGADVRQAGEALGPDFPAVEIVDGGDADELVLRRNLIDVVLPVCMSIVGNTNVVFINSPGGSGSSRPECQRVDGNGNGWDDRHEAWQAYRCAQDGVPGCQGNSQERVRAFVYNPVTGEGEWFTYDQDDMSHFKIHKSPTPSWSRSYPASDRPRLYLLEERRYRLSGDLIELVLNGDTANPQSLVDRIDRFRLRAQMSDGSWKSALGSGDDWTDIARIEVEISGSTALRGRRLSRTLKGSFLPRNVLSY